LKPANGNGAAPVLSLDVIDKEIAAVVADAQQFAEASPWPEPQTATIHVFAEARPPATGSLPEPGSRAITFVKATHEALSKAMADDSTIFVLGEGSGQRGGNFKTTDGLFDRFGPERLRDTPICERGFVSLACGAAMTGSRPVVDFMFADFVLDAVG